MGAGAPDILLLVGRDCCCLFCFFVLDEPGEIRQEKHQRHDGRHDDQANDEIGGQNVKDGGRILGTGHEQIVGTRADDAVGGVGYDGQHAQQGIRLDGRADRRAHLMYEDHIENGDIAQRMLQPELIVAEAGRARVGDDRRGDQGEDRTREQPEVDDVKQRLRLGDDQIAAKDDGPAAHGDGQMIHGIGIQIGNAHKTPEIGHLRDDHGKGQCKANAFLVFPFAQLVAEAPDEQDDGDHEQNGSEVRE